MFGLQKGGSFIEANKGTDAGQFWAPGMPNGTTSANCLWLRDNGLSDESCTSSAKPGRIICEKRYL